MLSLCYSRISSGEDHSSASAGSGEHDGSSASTAPAGIVSRTDPSDDAADLFKKHFLVCFGCTFLGLFVAMLVDNVWLYLFGFIKDVMKQGRRSKSVWFHRGGGGGSGGGEREGGGSSCGEGSEERQGKDVKNRGT